MFHWLFLRGCIGMTIEKIKKAENEEDAQSAWQN
jgi:hypothetical protein